MSNFNTQSNCFSNNCNNIKIFTGNIYYGADFVPLIFTTPEDLLFVTTQIFQNYLSTNIEIRAKYMAYQIAKYIPDIINLQEAALWKFIMPGQGTIVYDHVKILICALKNLGLNYKLVAEDSLTLLELPSSVGATVSFLDRDAILVRESSNIKILTSTCSRYTTNLQVSVAGTEYTIYRGWCYLDICKNKMKLRLINTHLDGISDDINYAQALELISGPANTSLPLIIVGDFNANANTTNKTYSLMLSSGFNDSWLTAGIGNGNTFGEDPSLLNVTSMLSRRIDYIFYKNDPNFKPNNEMVIAHQTQDKTCMGEWVSDHGFIVGTINY